MRSQWGSEYTVVSVEGLEIDDTLATQGQLVTYYTIRKAEIQLAKVIT